MDLLKRASSPFMATGRVSPRLSPTSIDGDVDKDMDNDGRSPPTPPILKLPPEIIQQIFSYLSAQHLASLYRTCRDLQSHTVNDRLWIDLLKPNLPTHDLPATPAPFTTFRDLYLAHHPHWFLPRHKVWFSDDAYTGKLIVIKFNSHRGSIEGYRLVAERPSVVPQTWSYKPGVLIHHLDPYVYVSTDDPVLSLSPPLQIASARSSWDPSSEIDMRVGAPTQKIDASLLLSLNLPEPTASTPSVAVWPPRIIPSMPRTRSSSSSGVLDRFTSRKHKPQTLPEISQTTFRLRTLSQFTRGLLSFGVRIGDEISTWSTLSPDLYTPTPGKPYQGIFVGDYAAHGCEFLLVLQNPSAPPFRHWSRRASNGRDRPSRFLPEILAALSDDIPLDQDTPDLPSPTLDFNKYQANGTNSQTLITPNMPDPDGSIHKGAIEAIKLTGDVNVPRGEHTFVADDIGPSGTIRIAAEQPFRGARVVRSRGHVASRGFQDGMFLLPVRQESRREGCI